MFLINKVSSKRTSRDFTASESVAAKINSTTAMEFNYAAPPMNEYTRPRTKRQSRSKSAFFGSSGGRSSFEEVEGRTSTRSSVNEKDGLGLISIGMKKKLRKAASKASFSPASPIREETERRPLGLRRVPESWSRKLASPSSSSSSISSSASAAVARDGKFVHPISSPFNFSHVSHANQRDFSGLHQSTHIDLARDWVRVSQLPPPKDAPEQLSPKTKKKKGKKPSPLSRAVLRTSTSTASSLGGPTPCHSQESLKNFSSPLSPPPRSSSYPAVTTKFSDDEPEVFCHAVTTPDESSFGRKSPGIERLLRDHLEAVGYYTDPIPEEDSEERPQTPDAPIPELREIFATPPDSHSSSLRTHRISLRLRPQSQISEMGDSGFIVPGSPLLRPVRQSIRASRRLSVQQIQALSSCLGGIDFDDSWEEDIDYSYEHAAESYCNFDWDKTSSYAGSIYSQEDDQFMSPLSPLSPITEPVTPQDSLLHVPEKKQQEKRITGQFEAELILPPQSETSEDEFSQENGILMRAASTALQHRSVRSSKSYGDLLTVRGFCDELSRVAEQLEDHIAFLNSEDVDPTMPGWEEPHPGQRVTLPLDLASTKSRKRPNRARTDSDATCVTLCSDSDTITPTESGEVITPPNSNHNSFALHKFASSEDMRLKKGLSFPASTIPGVIEFSPEIHHIPVEENEFVTYI